MNISKSAFLALGATLLGCDADQQEDLSSRLDELGTRDAGANGGGSAHGDAGRDGTPNHWDALLACVQPRLKDCSDGQIVAIVTATNEGEIAMAKALRPKLTEASAQKLADHLIEQHGKAQAELDALLDTTGITPIANHNSAHLTEMNELTLAALDKKRGDALVDSYVTHQLLAHAQVIGTLDHVLLPSVKSPELKKYLEKTRKEVGTHTELVAKTQAELQGPCGGDLSSDAGVPSQPGVAHDGGPAPAPTPVVIDAGRTELR